MLVLHAAFPIDPDRRDDALELVEKSNQEEGKIDYRAAVDVYDESVIRFFEQYEDVDAFEAHTRTEHFQEFEKQLPELVAGEPKVIRFDVDDVTERDL